MFTLINSALLQDSDAHKKWYRDAQNGRDVFVWTDERQQIIRLQFWQEADGLEWDTTSGLRFGRLDEQSGSFNNLQAPTFRITSNAPSGNNRLLRLFKTPHWHTGLPDDLTRFMEQTVLQ